jgi:hypothetical protein
MRPESTGFRNKRGEETLCALRALVSGANGREIKKKGEIKKRDLSQRRRERKRNN